MKKILGKICILLLCFIFCSCSKNTNIGMYADAFEINPKHFEQDKIEIENMNVDDNSTQILQNLKPYIVTIKKKYPILNYDRLNDVEIFVADDLILKDSYGVYDNQKNQIIIFQDEQDIQSAVIHNLMYLLIQSEKTDETGIADGLADFLGIKFAIENGIDFTCKYKSDLKLIYIYETIFGKDTIINDCISGEFLQKIEKYSSKEYVKKFKSAAMAQKDLIKKGVNPKESHKVLLNILFCVAINYSNELSKEEAILMLENVQEFLDFDDIYLNGIIKNKLDQLKNPI